MLMANGGEDAAGGLFLVIILVAIGLTIWGVTRWRTRDARLHHSGIAVLDERYAKGEIDRDEYMKRRDDLKGK